MLPIYISKVTNICPRNNKKYLSSKEITKYVDEKELLSSSQTKVDGSYICIILVNVLNSKN